MELSFHPNDHSKKNGNHNSFGNILYYHIQKEQYLHKIVNIIF